ncbi:MAG: hypothetical protein ACI841_000203 [Planctomycetota bacterium]|jgi:uncharacterized protein (DUF58 family)
MQILAPELSARVKQIQIRTHRLVDAALSGGYRSTFRGQGIEFAEVRPYLPGDDIRSIDWKVTARVGEPYIKTYAEERELTLNLVVDTSESMDFGSGRYTKREAAAQFASLIALVALRAQDRVGLDLFGDHPRLHLPPRKGSRHVLRIVREVLAAQPSTGGSNFAEILHDKEQVMRRQRGLVFLISDFLGHTDCPGWGDSLTRLAQRHDVICVRVFDPLEESLPAAGMIGMREIESGRLGEIDSRSKAVRRGWRALADERRAALDVVLDAARVDHIELPIDRDLADPLVAFFHRRVRSGRTR